MTTYTWPGWQNVELIGEGSFGKVFRIRREEFGRAYEAALKVITIPQNHSDIQAAYAEGMDDESVTDYFRSCVEDIVAEFALMSQLKGNSNIVSYEDHMVVQHEDGIGWDILIRMELLTPLMTYVRSHPLDDEDVIRLGIDMARALKLCRKKGILHRDIKPENIFVSDDGDFKLGDFGVARVAEKTVSAMSKKGTYTYMAPEVYKGEKYGFAADLYSLGIVLYRFLNDNRLPYMPPAPQPIQFRDRERALNARVMGKPMPEPTHGTEALKAVVMKTCAYTAADRYASAEELEQALMMLQKPVAPAREEPEEKYEKIYISPYTEEQRDSLDPLYRRGYKRVEEIEDDDWDDEDDFEKTVSSFSGFRAVKREEEPDFYSRREEEEDSVPSFGMSRMSLDDLEELNQEAWEELESDEEENDPCNDDWADDGWDDDDDFEKTVSTFSARKPAKKQAMTESEPEEFEEDDDDDDEDEFDRTVSAFTARPKKPVEASKPVGKTTKAKPAETKKAKEVPVEKEKPRGLFGWLFGGKKKK